MHTHPYISTYTHTYYDAFKVLSPGFILLINILSTIRASWWVENCDVILKLLSKNYGLFHASDFVYLRMTFYSDTDHAYNTNQYAPKFCKWILLMSIQCTQHCS